MGGLTEHNYPHVGSCRSACLPLRPQGIVGWWQTETEALARSDGHLPFSELQPTVSPVPPTDDCIQPMAQLGLFRMVLAHPVLSQIFISFLEPVLCPQPLRSLYSSHAHNSRLLGCFSLPAVSPCGFLSETRPRLLEAALPASTEGRRGVP